MLFFFQAEDGIRDLVRSRGLGDVYKRQHERHTGGAVAEEDDDLSRRPGQARGDGRAEPGPEAAVGSRVCLLYTSDAADERSSVDLGGRRIIKKKKKQKKGPTRTKSSQLITTTLHHCLTPLITPSLHTA